MPFIAFPLRLEGPFLKRTDEPEAVLQLIGLMARTPHGSWPGCRTFGVRDLFEGLRLRPENLRRATDAINDTLIDLGITHYRLEAIQREPVPDRDTEVFSFVITETAPGGRKYTGGGAR